jgi:hypothetical protein
MSHGGDVERPYRKSDYRIRFATREAQKGWTDLVATLRNAAVDAWEFLTSSPTDEDGRCCYPLKGDLGTVVIAGETKVWSGSNESRPATRTRQSSNIDDL